MRITDLFLAFPSLLLAMAIAAALGPGLRNAAIALVISWWPWYTRLVRGVAVSLRSAYFVEAAQRCRRARPDHHSAPHPAQHHLADPGAGDGRYGHRDPGHGWAGLSGHGHTAAGARLGPDGRRRTLADPRSVVDFAPSPAWPSSLWSWLSTCWVTPCATSSTRGSTDERRRSCRSRPAPGVPDLTRPLRALNGITLAVQAGRDLRHRGRNGLRQDGHRAFSAGTAALLRQDHPRAHPVRWR